MKFSPWSGKAASTGGKATSTGGKAASSGKANDNTLVTVIGSVYEHSNHGKLGIHGLV